MPSVEVETEEATLPRYLRNVGESPTPDDFTVSGIYPVHIKAWRIVRQITISVPLESLNIFLIENAKPTR